MFDGANFTLISDVDQDKSKIPKFLCQSFLEVHQTPGSMPVVGLEEFQ